MSNQIELFHWPTSNQITLSEALEILWDLRLKTKPSGRSFNGNRIALCKTMGHKYLDQIYDIDFENHREIRLNGLRGVRKVGDWAVFHDHTLLSLVYNSFRRWKRRNLVYKGVKFGEIKLPVDNPTIGVKKVKGSKRRRIVTPNEFSLLIEHADHDLADLLLVLLDTGMRLNDALKLEPSNFTPSTNTLFWIQNKTRREVTLPLDHRCRRIFLKAIKRGGFFDGVRKEKITLDNQTRLG
jgi:integrase